MASSSRERRNEIGAKPVMINWRDAVDLSLFDSNPDISSQRPSSSMQSTAAINHITEESSSSSTAPPSGNDQSNRQRKIFNFNFSPQIPDHSIKYSSTDGSIESASFERILERATSNPEPALVCLIVRTYSLFLDPYALFDALCQRFEAKEAIITSRTLLILKDWIEKNPYGIITTPGLLEEVGTFIKRLGSSNQEYQALARSYTTLVNEGIASASRIHYIRDHSSPPLTTMALPLTITNVDSWELARQITLFDLQSFGTVSIDEWLLGLGDGDNRLPVTLQRWNDWSRRMTSWVSTQILMQEGLRNRVKVLICFLESCLHLKELHNCNGIHCIGKGTLHPSIKRLKQTSGALHTKLFSLYHEFEELICQPEGNNAILLKDFQEKLSKPVIPSAEILQEEMQLLMKTFAVRSSADPKEGLLNIKYLKSLSSLVEKVHDRQSLLHSIEPLQQVRELIINPSGHSDAILTKLSEYHEPPIGTERGKKPVQLMTEDELQQMKDESDAYKPEAQVPSQGQAAAEWSVSLGRDGLDYAVIYVPGYRFYNKDTSYNIKIEVVGERNIIRAATVEKMIEHMTPAKLTSHDEEDLHKIFFATHHGFTSSAVVLDLLMMRYQPPKLVSQDAKVISEFTEKYENPVRSRICTLIRYWLTTHHSDFNNPWTRERLRDFLITKVEKVNPQWAKLLLKEMDLQLLTGTSLKQNTPITSSKQAMNAMVNNMAVLDFDITHITQQLCLLFHQYWSKIALSELLNVAWVGPQAYKMAPNVVSFRGIMTKVSYNVEVEVLKLFNSNKFDDLAKTISAWLQIAQRSQLILRCWPVAETIVEVLQHCFSTELTQVWKSVPKPLIRYFNGARHLFADRDKYLASALDSIYESENEYDKNPDMSQQPQQQKQQPSLPPQQVFDSAAKTSLPQQRLTNSMNNSKDRAAIPPLELILSDILQIEENQSTQMMDLGPRVINFDKFRMIYDCLEPIVSSQVPKYSWVVDHRVRAWLLREPRNEEIPHERFAQRFAEAQRLSSNFATPAESPAMSRVGSQNVVPSKLSSPPSSFNQSSTTTPGTAKNVRSATQVPTESGVQQKIEQSEHPSTASNEITRYISNTTVRIDINEIALDPRLTETPDPESSLQTRISKYNLIRRAPMRSQSVTGPPSSHEIQHSAPTIQPSSTSLTAEVMEFSSNPTPPLPPPRVRVTSEALLRLFKTHAHTIPELKALVDEVIHEVQASIIASLGFQDFFDRRKKMARTMYMSVILSNERISAKGRRNQIRRSLPEENKEYEFKVWKHLDRSGFVYGFCHPVVHEVAYKDNHHIICSTVINADISDVALLFKASELYKTIYSSAELPLTVSAYLFYHKKLPSAISSAIKTGIRLLEVMPPPDDGITIEKHRTHKAAPTAAKS